MDKTGCRVLVALSNLSSSDRIVSEVEGVIRRRCDHYHSHENWYVADLDDGHTYEIHVSHVVKWLSDPVSVEIESVDVRLLPEVQPW